MVSAQQGLIPQMSGRLTNLRIMGATVFVDHYSDHVYVYLMRDLTLSETLMAKHAYERFLASLGVDSKAYYADNGRFADKGFRDDCVSSNQTITFCGVGSHHQNGIAERKIKDITLGASRAHFDYSLAICCKMLRGSHESFGSSCRWTNAFQNSCKSRLVTA
jgi:hypothetical protein